MKHMTSVYGDKSVKLITGLNRHQIPTIFILNTSQAKQLLSLLCHVLCRQCVLVQRFDLKLYSFISIRSIAFIEVPLFPKLHPHFLFGLMSNAHNGYLFTQCTKCLRQGWIAASIPKLFTASYSMQSWQTGVVNLRWCKWKASSLV